MKHTLAFAAAAQIATAAVAAELPEAYTRVEFVETRGNQWIDTGYYPGPLTSFTGDVQMVGKFVGTDNNGCPFGACDRSSGSTVIFSGNFSNVQSDHFLIWCYSVTSPASERASVFGADAYNGKRMKLAFDATTRTFVFGGLKLENCTVPEEALKVKLGIGAQIRSDSAARPFQSFRMRIYGWKLWTGTTLERDYVPCVRKQDNVGGLYDLKNGEFCSSEGDPFVVSPQTRKSVLEFPGTTRNDESEVVTFTFEPSLGSFSACAWVRNVSPGVAGTGGDSRLGIVFGQGAVGSSKGFACYVSSSDAGATCKLAVQIRESGSAIGSVGVDWTSQSKDDKWHLVAITHDQTSGGSRFYVDGELAGRFDCVTTSPVSTQPFAIGLRKDGSFGYDYPVKGCIAEVSLWNRVLDPNMVKRRLYGPLSGKEKGLVGYWPLTNYTDLFLGEALDGVNNGSPSHVGVIGSKIQVIDGEIGFRPGPGLAITIY